MADKPVVISLKTVAQTGDVEQLIEYIQKLGASLKKVGTQDARAFRDQLAQTLKSVNAQKKAGTLTPDAVKAMVPQIGKQNALFSISQIDQKLASYGTAQAKAIQRTVSDIKGALENGDLSENTIDVLEKSLDKFVEQANKLPPEGLEKLGYEIRRVIGTTKDLGNAISAINDVDFKLPDTDDLFDKIDISKTIGEIRDAFKDAKDNIAEFGDEGGNAILKLEDQFKEFISNGVGRNSVKELDNFRKALVAAGQALSGKELAKGGERIKNMLESVDALKTTLTNTGVAFIDNFNVVDSVMSATGVRVSSTTEAVVALAGKIPLIGAAIKALPIGWILALVGAAVKAVDILIDKMKKEGSDDAENEQKTREQTMEGIADKAERQNHIRDLAYAKEKMIVAALRDQQDAMLALERSQDNLNREKEKYGLLTEEESEAVDLKYDASEAERERMESMRELSRTNEDADMEIDYLTKQLEARRAEKQKYQTEARTNSRKSNEYAEKIGWSEELKSRFNLTGVDVKAESERYGDRAKQANDKAEELQREIENITQAIEKQQKVKETADAKAQTIEAKYATEQQKILQKQFERERQFAQIDKERAREMMLFERGRADEERAYQRGKREPWQNVDEQIEEAQKEFERVHELEKKAYAEREKVLEEFAASGRHNMTTEEQTAFNNATADLSTFRSARYQEQERMDRLQKQKHDRQFERGMTDYAERKEDADWRRQGQYERANWSQRLRMDEERYAEGKRMFEAADAKIRADEAGTKTLSPEERRIAERERAEGREKMTQTRDSIRSAILEGDSSRVGFVSGLLKQGNRLTQMGLGGDVANWDRQTATNTRTLVSQNRELIGIMRRSDAERRARAAWGM